MQRSPRKLVWFTAPKAVLVDQQCRFLKSQLPAYTIKPLTGQDQVDTWKSSQIWETVLRGVNIIVTTPQILCDALQHAYVKLQIVSLLVIDECHHCQADDPSARIMKAFYHPQKGFEGLTNLPHILGLTASPQIGEKSASIQQLELALDAKCRSPTVSIEQYKEFTQKAVLIKRLFTPVLQDRSHLLQSLGHIVSSLDLQQDPYYQDLLADAEKDDDSGLRAKQKVKKYKRSGQTPAIADVKKLLGNAEHLHETLGAWACDLYVNACVSRWRRNTLEINEYHDPRSSQYENFISGLMQSLQSNSEGSVLPCDTHISAKAFELIEFLISAYHKDIFVIVFVERRAVAWALCQLLQADPRLACYGVFSYVGQSLGKSAALHEDYVTTKQDIAFMDFRKGSRNLCISTSVAEEGIDIQAVNVVVRFDDPKQQSSYVQSRGRARCKDSKIVRFQNTHDESSKYERWNRLEMEMELQYRQEEEELQRRLEHEQTPEDSDEVYRIDTTGARLDLNASVPHLAHYCAKVPIPWDPIYILDGEVGVAVSATVLLPSTVPPPLRQAHSCRTWRSERMAKRDAAFHALKALHSAGLINNNLVPFEEEFTPHSLQHVKQLREVAPEKQVWLDSNKETGASPYRVEVRHGKNKYLSLVMILPSTPMKHKLCFPLSETSTRHIEVTVVPLGPTDDYHLGQVEDYSETLFNAAFQAGSASNSLKDPNRLSCMLFPEFYDSRLGQQSTPLEDFLCNHNWLRNLQPLLLWRKCRQRPYVWCPPHVIEKNLEGRSVLLAKQVRKLQIFAQSLNVAKGQATLPQDKELLLEECEARGIASVYGPIVLLLPSILHYMATAIRAQHARETVLRPIGFSSTQHLVPALIAKSASGTYNYERLEFLGDTCLKYLTSVQVFFDHPLAPEGLLTRKAHEILGNTRLERATNEAGLAPYITTEVAKQKHWKLPICQEDSETIQPRSVLSKTLADVTESILGAAYLDGEESGQAVAQCVRALQLLIPEIPWQTPECLIGRVSERNTEERQESILQRSIKQMLGSTFEDPALLAEALTHSTDDISQPALDRLEFLGDAILDQVVKVRLFEYDQSDAGRLTVCRHALVSHAFLAYLALGIYYDQTVDDTLVDKHGSPHIITTTKQVSLTDLIKFREVSMREPITAAKTRYDMVRDEIKSELNAGKFPWTLLRSLDAPKVCSDIMESLLAALYLGANRSLTRCEELLAQLGMMELLKQMATNTSFEVRTPATILRELCAEHNITVSIRARCEQEGRTTRYVGEVRLEEPTGGIAITRTASCLEEARSIVAEAARDFLLLLQRPNHEAAEHEPEDLVMNIDTDTVMAEAFDHESDEP